MKLFYLPIWIFLIVCALYNVRFVSYKNVESDYFDKNNTGRIKGILAIVILLDHVAALVPVQGDVVFKFFHAIGFFAVAMFFFFSGYGVEKQRKLHSNYLDGKFIIKKAIAIVLPLYIVNFLYICAEILMDIWHIDLFNWRMAIAYVFDITGHYIINVPTWYIRSLVLLLTIYWIAHKCIKKEKISNVIILIAILLITIYKAICWNTGTGQEWGMLFCFWVGSFWARNESKIVQLVKARYFLFLFSSGISTVFFCGLFLLYYDTLFGKLVFRNLGTCSFVVLFTLLLMTIRVNSKLCDFFGVISLEIYLVHSLVIGIVSKYFGIEWIKVYFIIICSILLALLINKFIVKLQKNLNARI